MSLITCVFHFYTRYTCCEKHTTIYVECSLNFNNKNDKLHIFFVVVPQVPSRNSYVLL